MADFKQAVQWLKEGKKVRRKNMNPGYYISRNNLKGIKIEDNLLIENDTRLPPRLQIWDFEADDWEIYSDCEKYPMCESQDAQIDCRVTDCEFYKGAGKCSNIPPAITLNEDKSFVCWSKGKEKTLSDKKVFPDKGYYGICGSYKEEDVKEAVRKLQAEMLLTPSPTKRGEYINFLLGKIKEIFGDKLI